MAKRIPKIETSLADVVEEYLTAGEDADILVIATFNTRLNMRTVYQKLLNECSAVESVKYWRLADGMRVYAVQLRCALSIDPFMGLCKGPWTTTYAIERLDGVASWLDEVAKSSGNLTIPLSDDWHQSLNVVNKIIR